MTLPGKTPDEPGTRRQADGLIFQPSGWQRRTSGWQKRTARAELLERGCTREPEIDLEAEP